MEVLVEKESKLLIARDGGRAKNVSGGLGTWSCRVVLKLFVLVRRLVEIPQV